jgi:DNA replication and repair protein RecF
MVNTLRAVNFRCWTELDLEMPTTGGIFVGQNAQGKTSILEAVCLLMRLQSPRTHKMASMIQVNSSQWGVVGEMSQSKRKVVYGASGILLEVDEEMRAGSSDYLADSGLVVWMGNEDLELICGSGEIRRRYLDFMGAQWDPE